MIGERFGELVAVAELPIAARTKLGNRNWLLRCDCGGEAIRTTSQLNDGAKRGFVPSCRECLVELRGGKREAKRDGHRDYFARLWEEQGSLYDYWHDERMCDEIRDALVAEFGEPVDESLILPISTAVGWRETPRKPRSQLPLGHDAPAVEPPDVTRAVSDWLQRDAARSHG